MVLDMATSVAAKGKIRRAQQQRETIPEGWALDEEGRPTTDPEAALRGVVLPFAGPKGSGISLMIDIFAGVMSGAAFAGDVGNQYSDFDRPQKVGHLFLAMRPDLFVSPSDYAKRMESLITRAKEGRRAAGFDEILMPGEPEERLANSRRRQGIALNRTERTLLAEEAKLVGTPPLT
jgi:LDH2 family malate/lactate/ureidoglycolate dehydrogenase